LYHALFKQGFLPSQIDNEDLETLLEVLNHEEREKEIEENKNVYSVMDW
jgi:DNA-binding TFAR19-related protein (PDSD5 family)